MRFKKNFTRFKIENLKLDKNHINDIGALEGQNELITLDLSHNNIGDLRPLKELKKLEKLGLEVNKIESLSELRNLVELKFLFLTKNRISDIRLASNFTKLERFSIGFNNISSIQNVTFDRMDKFTLVSIDKIQIDMFKASKLTNYKVDKRKEKNKVYKFLKGVFLVTEEDLEFVDCQLTLSFMRRNIHFNLFYNQQVDLFMEKCRRMDLDI
jgi:Leucine-rich repeat (LRR) protein